jgi:glycosyltransferase involved in cell wall biosynthesis
MKKINLLFDASLIIQNINSKNINRSGIYFVAYNLLRCFAKSNIYKTILLVPSGTKFTNKNELEIFLSSFPIISLPDEEENRFKKNISVHKEYIKKSKNIIVTILRLLKIFKNILLMKISRRNNDVFNNIDVFFTPIFAVSDIIKNKRFIKKFHILYDCIPILKCLSEHSSVTMSHWFSTVLQTLNTDTYYFCISECTKRDFLSELPGKLDKSKMIVTPLATSQTFFPVYNKDVLKKTLGKYGIIQKQNETYIFSLCNKKKKKNLIFTIKCFINFIKKHKIDNMRFYLSGGFYETYINKFYEEIPSLKEYKYAVVLLGYIDDEDINILYSNSLFFTYISQYEGFGMPPLEAMQAGTPVITSNSSSLPEVVGDAAIKITYNDEDACIKAFEDLYYNENMRKEYIAKGIERAKLFSWNNTFKLMSDKIIEVLKYKTYHNQNRKILV